jgi:hypothetical protein
MLVEPAPDPLRDRSAFAAWQVTQRQALCDMLRMPQGEPVALDAQPRGQLSHDGMVVETSDFGRWCCDHGYPFEPLYGTPLHLLGATVVDMQMRPLRREQLAVLRTEELGLPPYTLEVWLDQIDPVEARRM